METGMRCPVIMEAFHTAHGGWSDVWGVISDSVGAVVGAVLCVRACVCVRSVCV